MVGHFLGRIKDTKCGSNFSIGAEGWGIAPHARLIRRAFLFIIYWYNRDMPKNKMTFVPEQSSVRGTAIEKGFIEYFGNLERDVRDLQRRVFISEKDVKQIKHKNV